MPKATPKTKAKTVTVPKKFPSTEAKQNFLATLEERFKKNMHLHKGVKWETVAKKLTPAKLLTVYAMEETGGEPDVALIGKKTELYFVDCSPETPQRRSLCYDEAARKARKKFPPKSSAEKLAKELGVTMLDEDQYRTLQELGEFDLKTSSWLLTPSAMRKLGGALFADRRFDRVFTYHNGAESYYGARGFRGALKV